MNISRSSAAASLAVLLATTLASATAADWPQWRGPNRNGHGQESGLLQEWPTTGPKQLWRVDDLGSGYSTPAVVGDRLYVMGSKGVDTEHVTARDTTSGKTIWTTPVGKVGKPDQKPSFPSARSTPTVEGDVLYALGSDGDLACLETKTGKVRWQHQLRTEFGGKSGIWAYAESPLIDGETLVCTPGGAEATVLALRKSTGEVLWKAALPEADEAGYASAIVVEAGGTKQYVQLLQKGLVGLAPKTGQLLWRYDRLISKYGANIPTPVADDGIIFGGAAGTGAGAVQLVASGDRVEAKPLYFEAKLPTAIGGAVKVGSELYGTTAQALLCVDFKTGQVKWEERAIGAASLCYVDHRLYLHGENGTVALVEPAAEGYREKGRFNPPDAPKHDQPMEKSWAYPVVSHGKLYLRDGATLWCYDVRKS
ncbi:MAG: PQQ-like beta-propeller repeat protein [Verrucomicrobiales bacterium]|nr:PQQ-like beta-propeller repeat protein [Verrucomicrobiales bacterium]